MRPGRTGKGILLWRQRSSAGLALACESDAAVALTIRMLALSGKGVIRAEAHRQAMMTIIDSGPTRNAHPALWAPFVVVGEGRSKPIRYL